jgi:biopolymer transport protein ExbD
MNFTGPRRPRFICKIDVAGFASIMIVLMVVMFFSAVISVQSHHGVSVNLPKVKHAHSMPEAQREDAMMVLMYRNGDVFFNRDLVSSGQLTRLIRQQLNYGSESRVYIRADARTPYYFVKRMLDDIGSAEIQRVAFLVEQKRQNSLN